MTQSEFRLFLDGAMALCAVLAIINVARYRSRGASAYILAVAFLVAGGALYLLHQDAPINQVYAAGAFVLLLLFLDLAVRSRRHGQ